MSWLSSHSLCVNANFLLADYWREWTESYKAKPRCGSLDFYSKVFQHFPCRTIISECSKKIHKHKMHITISFSKDFIVIFMQPSGLFGLCLLQSTLNWKTNKETYKYRMWGVIETHSTEEIPVLTENYCRKCQSSMEKWTVLHHLACVACTQL